MSQTTVIPPAQSVDAPINRRQHDRYRVAPMYTSVTVQQARDGAVVRQEGHVYDISEGGLQLELDEPLDEQQPVAVHVDLPNRAVQVFATADVAWIDTDVDEPGPRRMALRFKAFGSEADRRRLIECLAHEPAWTRR